MKKDKGQPKIAKDRSSQKTKTEASITIAEVDEKSRSFQSFNPYRFDKNKAMFDLYGLQLKRLMVKDTLWQLKVGKNESKKNKISQLMKKKKGPTVA